MLRLVYWLLLSLWCAVDYSDWAHYGLLGICLRLPHLGRQAEGKALMKAASQGLI